MIEAEICDIDPAYEALEPGEIRAPVVFNSPHSGRVYPPHFIDQVRLELPQLRRSEDSGVDELFKGVVERGMPLMRVHFPRSMVDVNREPYELDPRMFDGRLPTFANTRSMRVAGGLGTIPRVVGEAQEIYGRRLHVDEALMRIETLYKPYHRALSDCLDQTEARFGRAILIDCHSMPSIGGQGDHDQGVLRPDIVLGDRFGAACAPAITEAAMEPK